MEPTMHVPRDVASYGDVVPPRRSVRERAGASANPMATRVLLAEGERLVRAGLRALLEGEPGLKVVAEAANSEDAAAAAAQHRPDVALVAVRLPVSTGPKRFGESSPMHEAVRRARSCSPPRPPTSSSSARSARAPAACCCATATRRAATSGAHGRPRRRAAVT
jgi:CheY-like chemotaxis protein